MLIIGLNAYHGDASAAAVLDGQLVAAAEEERFTRIKHSAGFPEHALRYVLQASGARPAQIDVIAVARDPWARLADKTWHLLKMPSRVLDRGPLHTRFARIADGAARALDEPVLAAKVERFEHHRAHLASSFLVSPFDEAALFSIDGLGDFASAMWGVGRGTSIEPMGEVRFPHSLGIFYTALTQYLGFPRYGDEYKVMGLASYGEPELLGCFREIVVAREGEMGFQLNPKFFTHQRQRTEMTWDRGEPILGRLYSDELVELLGPARGADEPLGQRHYAIASSLQARLEEIVLDRLRTLQLATGLRRLCLAGGVAFNCVLNGKIRAETGFEDVFVQPAAGDAGLAIGAAMSAWHRNSVHQRDFVMEHAYWGPQISDSDASDLITSRSTEIAREGCVVQQFDDEQVLTRRVAADLAHGKVIGWFQGRMEWGPRALGNRSIFADPRRPGMREILNLKIKRREPFRPFAPVILEERLDDYFVGAAPSPFMQMAYRVRPQKRCSIPAVTHVDGTGRVQTVHQEQNPLCYRLIREFEQQTGVPVLLNTSFNENEPVVCKPEEAMDCFLRTRMDGLVVGNYVVSRACQH